MRVAWLFLASSTLLMAGCSVSKIETDEPVASPTAPAAANVAPVKGTVHGGQQPIWKAHIYMFAVSTTGYTMTGANKPSTSLLTDGPDTTVDGSGNYYVTTSSNGNFTITRPDYSCGVVSGNPVTQQVYLYSIGGQTGSSATQANPAAGLMAVLGPCTSNSFTGLPASVQMNEVTTVAAAYALAGYATDATDMSGSNTALAATGIANAAATAANLADLGSGLAQSTTPSSGVNGTGTVPTNEINTLADILSACINVYDSGYSSSEPSGMDPCGTLFGYTTVGTTAPTDTASAAINIAHNPGANVASLFNLATATAPFQPILSGGAGYAPNDWTVAITYTGDGLNSPSYVAIDGSGNVWTTNTGNGSISKFGPAGQPLFNSAAGAGGLDDAQGIAIDNEGNVWVVNVAGTGSLSEFGADGSAVVAGGYTETDMASPFYLAIDGSDHIWVANGGNNTITEYAAGVPATGSPFSGGGLTDPAGIAVDDAGNVWTANAGSLGAPYTGDSITELPVVGGVPGTAVNITGGGLSGPYAIAVDHGGNAWITNLGNYDGVSITEVPVTAGVAQTPVNIPADGASAGGLNGPDAIAIDGGGNVWVANNGSSPYSLSEFTSGTAVSPSTGYMGEAAMFPYGSVLLDPTGIAIDGSGNVWVVNPTFEGTPDNVVEFVGAAVPVVTPLAAGVKNGTLGTTP